MDRLSAQDAAFLDIEAGGAPMHIGSIGIFDGAAPAEDEMRRLVLAKLPDMPRYRQRLRPVPLALGRPVWADDPEFEVDDHLHRVRLGDSTETALCDVVGDIMTAPLPRRRPLWEMWVVEGLAAGRWALVSKVHHALVDGVAGSDLLAALLDESPHAEPAEPDGWEPEPTPSGAALAVRALAGRASHPVRLLGAVPGVLTAPGRAVWRAAATAKGVVSYAGAAVPKRSTSLNGRIGPGRRYRVTEVSLDEVKRMRRDGATVNDVVLTLVSAGFRDLLRGRGEDVTDRSLRTLVPVSVRGADEVGGNRVSAVFAELPVGIPDPADRLAAVHEQLRGLKDSGQAVAGDSLVAMAGFAPPLLLSLGLRAAFAVPQPFLNTVVTNVPGPQRTLYAGGRRMHTAYPYVPIGSNVRVTVAVFSYDGTLFFGLTGDADTTEDLDVLARGIRAEADRLLAGAQPPRRSSTSGSSSSSSRAR